MMTSEEILSIEEYCAEHKIRLDLILAEEMPLFSARIPNDGSKTAFLHKNSNPCRKNA
jgi:hypothetical protein